jgi:hypothetical protein
MYNENDYYIFYYTAYPCGFIVYEIVRVYSVLSTSIKIHFFFKKNLPSEIIVRYCCCYFFRRHRFIIYVGEQTLMFNSINQRELYCGVSAAAAAISCPCVGTHTNAPSFEIVESTVRY